MLPGLEEYLTGALVHHSGCRKLQHQSANPPIEDEAVAARPQHRAGNAQHLA